MSYPHTTFCGGCGHSEAFHRITMNGECWHLVGEDVYCYCAAFVRPKRTGGGA
jgi:hypothetical protein